MPLDEREKKQVTRMFKALKTPCLPLTKWERGFYKSLVDQFKTRHDLSERQFELLKHLFGKNTI